MAAVEVSRTAAFTKHSQRRKHISWMAVKSWQIILTVLCRLVALKVLVQLKLLRLVFAPLVRLLISSSFNRTHPEPLQVNFVGSRCLLSRLSPTHYYWKTTLNLPWQPIATSLCWTHPIGSDPALPGFYTTGVSVGEPLTAIDLANNRA